MNATVPPVGLGVAVTVAFSDTLSSEVVVSVGPLVSAVVVGAVMLKWLLSTSVSPVEVASSP